MMSLRKGLRIVRRQLGLLIVRSIGGPLLRTYLRTWTYRQHGEECWSAALEGAALVCLWHGDLLLGLGSHRNEGLQVLVSPSGDGELVARLLPGFGYRVIRGSTNQGGTRALREMRASLAAGNAGVVVTPDGPRGPRHSTNRGVAYLARHAGLPIVVLGLAANRAWHFRSWDRFALPKPGARITVVHRAVEQQRSDSLEEATERLHTALMAAAGEAQRLSEGGA